MSSRLFLRTVDKNKEIKLILTRPVHKAKSTLYHDFRDLNHMQAMVLSDG